MPPRRLSHTQLFEVFLTYFFRSSRPIWWNSLPFDRFILFRTSFLNFCHIIQGMLIPDGAKNPEFFSKNTQNITRKLFTVNRFSSSRGISAHGKESFPATRQSLTDSYSFKDSLSEPWRWSFIHWLVHEHIPSSAHAWFRQISLCTF